MDPECDKIMEEINAEPLLHRVMMLDKIFETSVGEAELGYFIKDATMFRLAMKTLHRMAINPDGKI